MLPCQLLFKEEGADPSRTLVVLLAGGGGRAFFDLGPGDQVLKQIIFFLKLSNLDLGLVEATSFFRCPKVAILSCDLACTGGP